jgi:hypothetical protein
MLQDAVPSLSLLRHVHDAGRIVPCRVDRQAYREGMRGMNGKYGIVRVR